MRSISSVFLRVAVCACVCIPVTAASADMVNLEWRPLDQTVNLGDAVGVGLYAVGADNMDVEFNSAQVIMTWDPTYLQLTGVDNTGAIELDVSAFTPGDSFGFNEANPPADGDGIWFGLASLGETVTATPDGTLLTTMMFDALMETECTYVEMLASGQKPDRPVAYTKVIQGTYNIVGDLSAPACVTIVPEPTSFALLGLAALLLRRR